MPRQGPFDAPRGHLNVKLVAAGRTHVASELGVSRRIAHRRVKSFRAEGPPGCRAADAAQGLSRGAGTPKKPSSRPGGPPGSVRCCSKPTPASR
ncbi:helix-turn-helix domain-containing protein [Arthrobacter sp. UKPF54-2]|nr:helix-turn-helix domain-containing protein [Arthrobacter sp. UKPF54-2]